MQTLEELAKTIQQLSRQNTHRKNTNKNESALEFGKRIIEYSKDPEVIEACRLENSFKRGRQFTVYGWVAKYLAEKYGASFPSANWMTSCARAALNENKKPGIKAVHKLNEWKTSGNVESVYPEKLLSMD